MNKDQTTFCRYQALILFLFAFCLTAPTLAASHDATLKITGDTVKMRWGVLGHNESAIDWHGCKAGKKERTPFFWNVEKKQPRRELVRLTHAFPLRMLRYHCGNAYNWRKAVGPVDERVALPDHWKRPMNIYPGFDEYLSWARSLPQPLEISMIASPFRPVDELADMVAYCNATTGSMAELRKANGYPEPFNVKIWELGNETDWAKRQDLDIMRKDSGKEKSERMTPEEYSELCRVRIAAMRKVDPNIKIFAHAKTAPWDEQQANWRDWHRTVLKLLGGQIDGIVVHPYYDGYPVPRVYAKTIDSIIADLRKAGTEKKKLTLWISEHARWINYKKRENWKNSWGISGAISTADFLIKAVVRPEIEYANYWSYGHSGPWRVLSRTKNADGSLSVNPTAIFQLFKLLNKTAMAEVVPLTVEEPEGGEKSKRYDYNLSAVLFKEDNRFALLACNRSMTDSFKLTLPNVVAGKIPVTKLTVNNPDGENGRAVYAESKLLVEDGKVVVGPGSVTSWLWKE